LPEDDLTFSTSETYLRGDAIWYSDQVAPVFPLSGSEMATLEYTVNSGQTTPSEMGRIIAMNGYSYPNRLTKVYDFGLGKTSTLSDLPQRCSSMDFSTEAVYTWMQSQPDLQL
jgi:hypothetical protein